MLTKTRSAFLQVRCAVVALWSEHEEAYATWIRPATTKLDSFLPTSSAQLRQFPGREKQLIDYYRSNPDAIASLRAPIFEEKVVDYLLELVKVTDKTVSREELMKEDEEEASAATTV